MDDESDAAGDEPGVAGDSEAAGGESVAAESGAEPTTWTVELVAPAESDLPFAGESREIEVAETETILGAARAAGHWLDADCQQGWCLTCAARLLDGEVDQSTAKRYYASDREADFVLPCTAKPRSDLVIVVSQYHEMLEHRAEQGKPPGRSKLGRGE